MSKEAIILFEESITGLLLSTKGGDHEQGVNTVEFAHRMFQIVVEMGSIECEQIENNQLRFILGSDTPRVYQFPFSIIRPILAAIAYFVCSQFPDIPGFGAFNVYGDSQEIEVKNAGQMGRFHVQTINRLGPTHLFRIRRLN